MTLYGCRLPVDLCSEVIRLLGGSTDYVGTDILARAHLCMYLVCAPNRMDKVFTVFSVFSLNEKDSDLMD